MRTYADRLGEMSSRRYHNEERELDPANRADAEAILSSRGGSKAAKIAIAELWAQASEAGQGYLPTARISAPLRVLTALETLLVVERATDDRGRAIRFRLTHAGLDMAAQAGAKA